MRAHKTLPVGGYPEGVRIGCVAAENGRVIGESGCVNEEIGDVWQVRRMGG